MNRQKIGLILFWLGVISIIVWLALTWIQSPILIGESINLTLSLSMLLLFMGHYLAARNSKVAKPSS